MWSPRGHIEINISISCLPGNRKWNYFCLFLKENSRDKKMEVDKHICVVQGDILKWIIPFPVCQKTGNGIIFCLFLKENSLDEKLEVDKHIFVVPGDILKWIIPFPVLQETGNVIIFAYSLRKIAKTRKWKLTSIFFYSQGRYWN